MRLPSVRPSRFAVVLLIILIAVMASGCSNLGGPRNMFSPEGTVARDQQNFPTPLRPRFPQQRKSSRPKAGGTP